MAGMVDTTNWQLVGINTNGQISVSMPRTLMTKDEALVHAAWLVALADSEGDQFAKVLREVHKT